MEVSFNKNSELEQQAIRLPEEFEVPEKFLNEAMRFREIMMMYSCAIREVRTKLEVLNDELSVRNQRNPIEMIKSRIKKPISIIEKLQRRNLPVSTESVMKNLDDVAGVRVICSFIDDIYEVVEMLARQDDVKVIAIKDYIRSPKVNGYRSYHMIIEVPVFFSDRKQFIRVEVQIRTIAMDFWASLEHKIYYKFEGHAPAYISHDLQECSKIVSELDEKMLMLNEAILKAKEEQEKKEAEEK